MVNDLTMTFYIAQRTLGGMWERCKPLIGAWGEAPEANAFCVGKPSKTTQKLPQKLKARAVRRILERVDRKGASITNDFGPRSR